MKMNRLIRLAIACCVLFPYTLWAQTSNFFLHTIKKGESLYGIANTYNVDMNELIRLNPGAEQQINAGETLKIPQATATNSRGVSYHTIQSGETLYQLTKRFHVSVDDICKVNPGLTATNFKAGQVIIIPAPSIASAITENQPSATKQQPAKKGETSSKRTWKDMHKVKKKETITSICKEYGITPEELIAENPELKNGELKRGEFIFIPYGKAEKKEAEKKAEAAETPAVTPSNEELLKNRRRKTEGYTVIKAAVLLPFNANSKETPEQMRMVEFYRGFLLAVDSIKHQGTSVDLYTYDTATTPLSSLLAREEMKGMHVIFGPVGEQQIPQVAQFAKDNNIRLVVPFASRVAPLFKNELLYQVNTPQSYLYSEVYEHFIRKFDKSKVIFVNAVGEEQDKAEFTRGLKSVLKEQGIAYTDLTLKEESTEAEVRAVLSASQQNVIVPTSDSKKMLNRVIPLLNKVLSANANTAITLFGYPAWQTYTGGFGNSFYALNTHFYSSFYTNNVFPEAVKFSRQYRRWYGKDMANTYPKYDLLGFDIGYFFLKGLSQEGGSLENNVENVRTTPIQTGFKFERVSNWGGFVNKKVFFINFTPNKELIRHEFE